MGASVLVTFGVRPLHTGACSCTGGPHAGSFTAAALRVGWWGSRSLGRAGDMTVSSLFRYWKGNATNQQVAVWECYVPYCDIFHRPGGKLYVSLLAKDAVSRAGIDLSKPFTMSYDKQRACFKFAQHEDDCR